MLSEKEAFSLKTACALVKFAIVSRTSITKSKDTIELLTRLIRRLDAFKFRRKERKAQRIVNMYGSINMPGIYGSIEIDEKDFIPL